MTTDYKVTELFCIIDELLPNIKFALKIRQLLLLSR